MRLESGVSSFSYRHRSSDGSIRKNLTAISPGKQIQTMGRGEWRNVALVHCVTASEKHRIRHPRAIEIGPFRASIASRINV